jgi:hypothetical protein
MQETGLCIEGLVLSCIAKSFICAEKLKYSRVLLKTGTCQSWFVSLFSKPYDILFIIHFKTIHVLVLQYVEWDANQNPSIAMFT